MDRSERFCRVSIISSEGPSTCSTSGWRCALRPGSDAYKSSWESGSDESVTSIGVRLGCFTAIRRLFLGTEVFAALCDLGRRSVFGRGDLWLELNLAGTWVFLATFLAGGGIKLSLNLVCNDSGLISSSPSRAFRGVRSQVAVLSALEVKDLRLYAWSCMGMRSNNIAVFP